MGVFKNRPLVQTDSEVRFLLSITLEYLGVVGEEVYIYTESPARTVQTSTVLVLSAIYLLML